MIRLIHCVKRRADVSVDEFRHFWNSKEFNELTTRLTDLASPIEIKKNLTLDIPLNTELQMERSSKSPFDGVIEIIWRSGNDVETTMANKEFNELYNSMFDLQQQYIDFDESRRFFTEYNND